MNLQIYVTLQLLQKMRDDTVCYILQFISEVTVMPVDHNLLFIDKLMCTHLNLSTFQLHEHLELGDRSAEYEMDIQTILTGILPFHI